MGGIVARRGGRVVAAALVLVLSWLALPAVEPGQGPTAEAQIGGVRVPILTYHGVDYSGSAYSVTPEQLDAQCAWLVANGYTAITLDHFWAAAFAGAPLPPKPVVLTNDDATASAPVFAEVIARYGLVATYFVNNTSAVTPEQILLLAQYGAVEAHTVGHVSLPGLPFEQQVAEIAQNKAYLEQITGRPVRFLAWPYGASDAGAVEAAAAAGIVGAFGLAGTAAIPGAVDAYYVPRIMIEVGDSLETFAAKVSWW